MANKIFFRNKHNSELCFSSEIFENLFAGVNVLKPIRPDNNSTDTISVKNYMNIRQVIEDDDMFMLLTESSFTKNELLILRDALYDYAKSDINGKSNAIREKINTMIFTNNCLLDNENEIIKN